MAAAPLTMYVSAGYRHIYRDGAELAEQGRPDTPYIYISEPSPLGISFETKLFPAEQYVWEWAEIGFLVQSASTDRLREFYQSLAPHACPASILVSIEDGVVGGSVVHAGEAAGFMPVYETHRLNDRAAAAMMPLALLAAACRCDDPETDHLFIGSAGSANYGHWIVDDLPRLKAALWLLARPDPRPVSIVLSVLGEAIDAIRETSVRLLLGNDVTIRWIDPARAYRFDRLFYPTPVSWHPIQKLPTAMRFVQALGRRQPTAAESGARRLFVSRSAVHGRALVNEREVVALLEDYGFLCIAPETHDFAGQVRLFAGAEIVVGVMGAAMTNSLFCPADARLIYLAPEGWSEPFYYDLAQTGGHRYEVLFGAVGDPAIPPHQRDFVVDIDALRARLETLVACQAPVEDRPDIPVLSG